MMIYLNTPKQAYTCKQCNGRDAYYDLYFIYIISKYIITVCNDDCFTRSAFTATTANVCSTSTVCCAEECLG